MMRRILCWFGRHPRASFFRGVTFDGDTQWTCPACHRDYERRTKW